MVLRNSVLNLYTLYLTEFWFLPSDAVNGSWSRRGNWVSERWSDFCRATQPVRDKTGFHWKSELVLPLLAIAKRWEFSSILFCDKTNSHNSTQGGLTIQGFSWAVAHSGQCWAFVQAVPPPGHHSFSPSSFSILLCPPLCSGPVSW